MKLGKRMNSSKALAMLGVLSIISPDNIPESIFFIDLTVELPERLQFCHDEFE
jgi:hypothetical protein